MVGIDGTGKEKPLGVLFSGGRTGSGVELLIRIGMAEAVVEVFALGPRLEALAWDGPVQADFGASPYDKL